MTTPRHGKEAASCGEGDNHGSAATGEELLPRFRAQARGGWGVAAGRVVGPAEANGASSIPQNMKEAEVNAKMTTCLQATIAVHFSFKGQCYKDGGGVSRPQREWS
jgi:hypothetical protein